MTEERKVVHCEVMESAVAEILASLSQEVPEDVELDSTILVDDEGSVLIGTGWEKDGNSVEYFLVHEGYWDLADSRVYREIAEVHTEPDELYKFLRSHIFTKMYSTVVIGKETGMNVTYNVQDDQLDILVGGERKFRLTFEEIK